MRIQGQQLQRWPDFMYPESVRIVLGRVIPMLAVGSVPVRMMLGTAQWWEEPLLVLVTVAALIQAAGDLNYPYLEGVTVSNSGFFGSQGRDILTSRPTIPNIDLVLSQFDPKLGSLRVENMEMETSALFLLGGGQGFHTGTICPAIANRREETFAEDYEGDVRRATEIAIRALRLNREKLRSRPGA